MIPNLNRRTLIQQAACGFGALAASAMATQQSMADSKFPRPHFAAKAKRIIFLFMQGGVSHVDSFDRKPLLKERNGQSFDFLDARAFANSGKTKSTFRVMDSPWRFRQYGQTGKWVSDLFPESARHVDDFCFVHSMHTEGVAHGPATLFLHCGSTNFIRPSFGSWMLYGLGTENENLPGFVSIAPSIGNGGPRNYGNAFLPAKYQGTPVGQAVEDVPLTINDLTSQTRTLGQQRRQLDLIQSLNRQQISRRSRVDTEFEAVLESFELAWRMQSTAPEIVDLNGESAETLRMYGIDDPVTRGYGQRCLLARRLCEAGVRFIQVNYGDNSANPAWDQHSNLPKHADHAWAVDKPIGALLQDLKQRGLLEDTLVWWGGEFGRTPYAQDNGTGRDHNPEGFTVWLAGGGVKAGTSYGESDEFGHQALRNKVHMHDLHATLMHLMGIDHERLTYRHAGRDYRLTDLYGRIVKEIIA